MVELTIRKIIVFTLLIIFLIVVFPRAIKVLAMVKGGLNTIDTQFNNFLGTESYIYVLSKGNEENCYFYKNNQWYVAPDLKHLNEATPSKTLTGLDFTMGLNKLNTIAKENNLNFEIYNDKGNPISYGELNQNIKNNLNIQLNSMKEKTIMSYRELKESNLKNNILKKTYNNLKGYTIYNNKKKYNGIEYLNEICKKYNIDPYFVLSVIAQESRGNRYAVSYTGCAGLFQFCWNTAFKEYSSIFTPKPKTGCSKSITCHLSCSYNNIKRYCSANDPRFDVKKSIDAGVMYINKIRKDFNNNLEKTLISYNAGESIANFCDGISNCDKLTEAKKIEVASYISHITQYYSSTIATS